MSKSDGKLCIIGVEEDTVLKDFIRAHVDFLDGEKLLVSKAYPNYACNGRTIRVHYSTRRVFRKGSALLPHFLYRRIFADKECSPQRIRDSLKAFFESNSVNCILAEFGTNGADIAPHAEALGIPLIVHFHGHDAHRTATVAPLREKYREMFRSAFCIISVSRYMTAALTELGCAPDKIVTNPYGPRDTYFDVEPDYSPTILALGRFTDIKANYLTLMAFRMAAAECPEARLVMAGDGELLEACRTLAEVWNLTDRVSFPGAVAHAENTVLFKNACCFVQHSVCPSYGDAEGTPVVILEAQAAGLPVIATRHAGITDAVVDGHSGMLVDERDVAGMARAMIQLLRSPETCRLMGGQARAHIRSQYSMAKHIGCLQSRVNAASGKA